MPGRRAVRLIRAAHVQNMPQIRVLKLDLAGQIVWQYEGRLVRRRPHSLTLEAFFDVGDVPVADVLFQKGDRFVETYFDNRMYNMFQVFGRTNHEVKGWYCNLSRPAAFAEGSVSWVDLALDLWISADGRQSVLDRDEFEALEMQASEREKVLAALQQLQRRFRRVLPPP
jgi:uncharacterized protein